MKRIAKLLLFTFLLVVVIYPALGFTYQQFIQSNPVEDVYEVSIPFSTHSSVAVGHTDVYRVYLTQGETVTVHVVPLTSYGIGSDPDLYVFKSSDGSYITMSAAAGSDTVTFTASTTGYYLICVYGFNGPNDRCYYSISIQSSGSSTVQPSQPSPSQPVGPAPQPQSPIQVPNFISQIVNTIMNGIRTTINTIFTDFQQYVVTPIFQVFQAIINGVRQAIDTIARGVETVLRSIFGGGS